MVRFALCTLFPIFYNEQFNVECKHCTENLNLISIFLLFSYSTRWFWFSCYGYSCFAAPRLLFEQ